MKFNDLVRSEDGKIINVDLEMSEEENAFFIAYAFNALLTEGILSLNDTTGIVEMKASCDDAPYNTVVNTTE